MNSDITDAIFPGSGPWAIPLLAEFEGLDFAQDKDFVIARFRFVDGPTVHVPIANRVLAPLIETIATLPAARRTIVPFPKKED